MKVSKLKKREQKKFAKEFAEKWKNRGDEKSDTQVFWLSLLRDVFGVENPEEYISFEKRIKVGHTKFIDAVIEDSEVFIEQKKSNIKLQTKIRQSDGTYLTPLEQVQRYATHIPRNKLPRWLVCCNFQEFLIFDWNHPEEEPIQIKLENLPNEYEKLNFLIRLEEDDLPKEVRVSLTAGEIVRNVYDTLHSAYQKPNDPKSLHDLNILCVRLVFCLYAEDSGLFEYTNQFHKYLNDHDNNLRRALLELFKVLNQKEEERDIYLEEDLTLFPYVNGGLFSGVIEIPLLDEKTARTLINTVSTGFNWSVISPTIFGAVFESTLNPETRREGGMHYTSIENIHKVIDPLFLDGLKAELEKIKAMPAKLTGKKKTGVKEYNKKDRAFLAFQKKLANLKFLDPACGSGNFLTETYLSLRKLENEVIKEVAKGQISMFENDIVQVSINNFYGIEINDFAVAVARTALWIAENQMLEETQAIVDYEIEFLPLKTQPNIVKANALEMDWTEVIDSSELSYIMGNPPFQGKKEMTAKQKNEVAAVFNNRKGCRNIDYVSAWYVKALDYMGDQDIKTALVSTNSITQGEQVPIIWEYLLGKGITIDYAWRTFVWNNESRHKAQVHCVIIGFSKNNNNHEKYIFDKDKCKKVNHINPYLVEGSDRLVTSSRQPICKDAPKISYGSMPIDNGALILSEDEVDLICKQSPELGKYCRPYIGGDELIRNKPRYCLWLQDASISEMKSNGIVVKHIETCKQFRANSSRKQTVKLAETPWLFGEIRQPDKTSMVIPKVSSQTRTYIPMDFVEPNNIINGSALVIHSADPYHFAVLNSNVHMIWMKSVAGRMKSDYQYSSEVVYNNFPWPDPTQKQKEKIARTGQNILNVRAMFPNETLENLYDNTFMRPELRKAHKANDMAVMEAYGFKSDLDESAIVEELFKLYEKLV